MENDFLTLDYEDIKSKYPKSIKKIEQWLKGRKGMSEAIAGYTQQGYTEELLMEQMVMGIISVDPRKLYDAFDSFGIFISINYIDGVFEYTNTSVSTVHCEVTRIQAERTAFISAFKELEKLD